MRSIHQHLLCFYVIIFMACTNDNHYLTDQINSLKSLTNAFETGTITTVDYKTTAQESILGDTILSMELIQNDTIIPFPYLKLVSQSGNDVTHEALITLEAESSELLIKGTGFNPWVQTRINMNEAETSSLNAYAFFFASGITSSGLHILNDTLDIHFH